MGLITIWRQHGASPPVDKIGLIHIYLPFGRLSLSYLTVVSITIAIFIWYIIYRSGLGLKIRACGEDPKSAEALGINVYRVRLLSTVVGGMLTGLAGAYLTVGWIGQFTRDISAGRGFIALANVAFSGWNPLIAIFGAMIFGFFDTLSIYLPIKIQTLYPDARITALTYLFYTLPYIATLIVVSIAIGRVRMPSSLGKPYIKE
jgi:simple sugar transport system permease protein